MSKDNPTWGDVMVENFEKIADELENLQEHAESEYVQEELGTFAVEIREVAESFKSDSGE